MLHIAIPYYSGSGHTRKLASFVQKGIETERKVQAKIIDIEAITEAEWGIMNQSHGIIFGTPTYMGSMAASFKLFLEKTSSTFWLKQLWANKIAAGFTIGSSPSGDKLNTLVSLSLFAAQHGMIWAGFNQIGSLYTKDRKDVNHDGSWLGFMASSNQDKTKLIRSSDETSAHLFGKRLAKVVKRWNEHEF